jgi:hypothetical protein
LQQKKNKQVSYIFDRFFKAAVKDGLKKKLLNKISTISLLAALIAKFPEVIGLDVELMEANVAKLQKAFFLKASALTGMIKRKPRALGVIVDCEGSCEGMCTRCFAHF